MNRNSAAGSFLLALTYLGLDKAVEAEDIAERLLAALLKKGHPLLLGFARALKAELALCRGRLSEAESWLQHQQLPPLFPLTRAYLPHLTAVKTLLAQNTGDSLQQATEELIRLREYHENIHHKRFSIEILAVQALLEDAQGQRASALSTLTQALRLAEPGGFQQGLYGENFN